jgi:hypothetical protein
VHRVDPQATGDFSGCILYLSFETIPLGERIEDNVIDELNVLVHVIITIRRGA